ncbi:unnamed protein product [Lepeophtheirus salmonis]|uniref:(salmon louse) hypothetical protein n=1 Tax=Lepeophtheirus salmonis TaxID=72036 RepID=A0A7R8H1P0_LEPSM|nr:unnamed protein product [Lepeophtheirus salmonis]CAF2797637.1 unnamed protein product [Lepeophtheirus salmonis]
MPCIAFQIDDFGQCTDPTDLLIVRTLSMVSSPESTMPSGVEVENELSKVLKLQNLSIDWTKILKTLSSHTMCAKISRQIFHPSFSETLSLSPPYQPQSNGQAERSVRMVKGQLT